jgi:hypothetical protein
MPAIRRMIYSAGEGWLYKKNGFNGVPCVDEGGTVAEDGVVTIPSTDKEYDPDCSCVLAESARNTSPRELLSFLRRPICIFLRVGCSDFVTHLKLHGWINIPGIPSRGPRYSE